MAKMVTRTRHTVTLYVHSLPLSILLCLLPFVSQKLLFSGIQRTESDRIPLHKELSASSPLASCSRHVPGSRDVCKELAMFLSSHNVTISTVHYVMSHDLLRLPSQYPTFRTVCFQGNTPSSSNTSTRWYMENTVTWFSFWHSCLYPSCSVSKRRRS